MRAGESAVTSEAEGLHCPHCGGGLSPHDRWRLACPADHRWYAVVGVSAGKGTPEHGGDQVSDPGRVADIERLVASPGVRDTLPPQVMLLLLGMLDREREGRSVPPRPEETRCPRCGEGLTGFESGDSWAAGLRCPADHEIWCRGGHVWWGRGAARVEIADEYADEQLSRTVRAWLESKMLRRQLPAPVLEVFTWWHDRSG